MKMCVYLKLNYIMIYYLIVFAPPESASQNIIKLAKYILLTN